MSIRTQSATEALSAALGPALQTQVPLARYTSARIGGPAEYLYIAHSADELARAARTAWALGLPLCILGAASNVLVSDAGVPGLTVINKAKQVTFAEQADGRLHVRAESGAMLPTLARACIARGGAGMAWAATVPGTVGGAVVNNAGAHGGDTAANLVLADVLQHDGNVRIYQQAELGYRYRSSVLKREPGSGVVLAAEFVLERGKPSELQAKLDGFVAHRKQTQPPGATIGSMFKNPPGDYAGRLIEAAKLKGYRVGEAQISSKHANFFVNLGSAKATDVYKLIEFSRAKVMSLTGTKLELEVELVGDWSHYDKSL